MEIFAPIFFIIGVVVSISLIVRKVDVSLKPKILSAYYWLLFVFLILWLVGGGDALPYYSFLEDIENPAVGTTEFFVLLSIAALVALAGLGIFLAKTWGYAAGLFISLTLGMGTVLLIVAAIIDCKGSTDPGVACSGVAIGLGSFAPLFMAIWALTFFTGAFLFKLLAEKLGLQNASKLVLGVGILSSVIPLFLFVGVPLYKDWKSERKAVELNTNQAILEDINAVRNYLYEEGYHAVVISYPSYLPQNLEMTEIDTTSPFSEVQYPGVFLSFEDDDMLLDFAQGPEEYTRFIGYKLDDSGVSEEMYELEDAELPIINETVPVHGEEAHYAFIYNRIKRLSWSTEGIYMDMACHGDCILSKEDMIKIAESMKSVY